MSHESLLRAFIGLALLAAVPTSAYADPSSEIGARVAAVMAPWSRPDSPGCSVALVRDGKLVHAMGYGMADLERGVANAPNTVFDLGSTSKQFTAASLLLLAADGSLGLDDDVRRWVPELRSSTPSSMITLRHLLHHTGGLRDYTILLRLAGYSLHDVAGPRETLEMLGRQTATEFPPGERFEYSNSGYFVLSLVIARAARTTYPELAARRLFVPLTMNDTHLHHDHTAIVRRRAIGYAPHAHSWKIDVSPWEQLGDGAVFSTVLDLARWDENFYSGKVGGRPLVDAMQAPGKLRSGKEMDYAAGLMRGTYGGRPIVSHGGAWGGYRSELLRFPTMHTSVIVLCNASSADASVLARSIARIALPNELREEAAPRGHRRVKVSAADLEAWAGTYREPTSGTYVQIESTGETLVAQAGARARILKPIGAGRFVLEGDASGLVLRFNGKAPRRTASLAGVANYEEVGLRVAMSADEQRAYEGRYRCKELGIEWTIRAGPVAPTLHGRNVGGDLAPFARDTLVPAPPPASAALSELGGSLAFSRNAHGGVTGFSLKPVGLRFERVNAAADGDAH